MQASSKELTILKCLTTILLSFIFFVVPILKINAGDVKILELSGPKDNTLTSENFVLSTNKLFHMEFKVPVVTGTPKPPNDIDAIYFEGHANDSSGNQIENTSSKMILFNGRKTNYSGKTMSVDWNQKVQGIPFDAKSYTWGVYDYYTGTKYADNKTFTFKKDSRSSKGWYHIDKSKRTNGLAYSFFVSAKCATKEDCETDRINTLARFPDIILGECKEYSTAPDKPSDEAIVKVNTDTTYKLLAPLPGLEGDTPFETDPTKNPCPFGKYLNIIIKLFLGIAGVLAVVMIVMGGIQYMTSDLVSSKEAGKESIRNAILGLLLALGAYLILNTINPDLLNVCLNNVTPVEIIIEGDSVDSNIITTKDPTGQTITLKACDTSELVKVNVLGTTLRVNKVIQQSLEKIDSDWQKSNPKYAINKSETGSYCCRNVGQHDCSGLKDPNKNISAHAFGLAVDINTGDNPQRTPLKTNMPSSFVNLFTSKGYIWGGTWSGKTLPDPMHFSAYSKEGGNISIKTTGSGNVTSEVYDSAFFNSKNLIIRATIKNYDKKKNHSIMVYNKSVGFTKENPTANNTVWMDGTDGNITVSLTDAEYKILKNKQVTIPVWSAGVGLDTKYLLIN